MSTVAVTGCSGYIGRKVCELLEKDDSISRVVGVDVKDPAFSTRNLEFYRIDVRSPELASVMEGCDAVVHLAAGPDVAGGMSSIVRAAAAIRAAKLVFASCTDVYRSGAPVPYTEESPVGGANVYAVAEEAARAYGFENRSSVVTILRLAHVAGPSMPAGATGKRPGQMVHEQDAARAVHHVLTSHLPGSFNVCADDVTGVSNERFRSTGFVFEHSAAEAARAAAEANRGWMTVGGVRFRPAWVAAAAGSIAALAIGSAARAARRAKS